MRDRQTAFSKTTHSEYTQHGNLVNVYVYSCNAFFGFAFLYWWYL